MTSVHEEPPSNAIKKLSPDRLLKNPRSCNERSDSGFSDCSNCSTPCASCVCNQMLLEKKKPVILEHRRNSCEELSHRTLPKAEENTSTDVKIPQDIEHDIEGKRTANSSISDGSSRPDSDLIENENVSKSERYQVDQNIVTGNIEKKNIPLENNSSNISQNIIKRSKVALMMEKFESFGHNQASSTSDSKFQLTNGDNKHSVKTNRAGAKAFDLTLFTESKKIK